MQTEEAALLVVVQALQKGRGTPYFFKLAVPVKRTEEKGLERRETQVGGKQAAGRTEGQNSAGVLAPWSVRLLSFGV